MRKYLARLLRRLADLLARPAAPSRFSMLPPTITAPGLEVAEIEVPELGKVFVRGLLLRDRLDLATRGEEGFGRVARMLSTCVLREDRSAVLDAEGWEVYGAKHFSEALLLWNKAQFLSGFTGEDPEKKN